MADPEKTELTIRSTMTEDSISPTVSISIRSVQSRTCTGTVIRDFTFRKIRNRKTKSCIPLSRSRGLSIRNATMISVKDSMNATGRPDIPTATDQPRISGKTRRPARRNLSFRSGQWSKVLSLRFWQRSPWSSLKNLKDASVNTSEENMGRAPETVPAADRLCDKAETDGKTVSIAAGIPSRINPSRMIISPSAFRTGVPFSVCSNIRYSRDLP